MAPCYKVICMRKVPVSNFNFCQWCVNGLRMVATTLEAGSSFQINIYLRRRTDLYYQSRIIISYCQTVKIQSHYKNGSIGRGDNILNLWQIYFIKCVFRLLWKIEHCSPIVSNHPTQFHFFFQTTSSHPNFKTWETFIFTSRLKCVKYGLVRYCLKKWHCLNTTK